MHECLDVFGERMTTTINGDAWGGTTFEITDANGAMSGSVDGAGCSEVSLTNAGCVLTQRGRAGLRLGLGELRGAVHASREAGAGALRLACTLRLSGAAEAASLTLKSPVAALQPRAELRAPLPRGAGALAAWAAHGGVAGGSLELRWQERLRGVAVVHGVATLERGSAGGAARATLSADVDVSQLLPETTVGAEWRSAEPRVARLRAHHTRPTAARFGGTYLSAEARLQPDAPFTRKDLRLLIGRRFLTPTGAVLEAAADAT
jgi:hypothetical protein